MAAPRRSPGIALKATPANLDKARKHLEKVEQKLIELLHNASRVMIKCSEVTPGAVREASNLSESCVKNLKTIQDFLEPCIMFSPIDIENHVTAHESHMRFRLASETCDNLLKELRN
mmetsp:Transcript_21808/g.53394  ORF Transcript_21808/g.53394 Transcript_21808/m.53394 type:complete len:117 (-) Transcript_21808:318-668(-)